MHPTLIGVNVATNYDLGILGEEETEFFYSSEYANLAVSARFIRDSIRWAIDGDPLGPDSIVEERRILVESRYPGFHPYLTPEDKHKLFSIIMPEEQ